MKNKKSFGMLLDAGILAVGSLCFAFVALTIIRDVARGLAAIFAVMR